MNRALLYDLGAKVGKKKKRGGASIQRRPNYTAQSALSSVSCVHGKKEKEEAECTASLSVYRQ